MKKVHYIGVLDIAGFEIFDYSDVQYSNIVNFLHGRINESFITFVNHNTEGSFVESPSNTRDRACSSGARGSLAYPLSSYLQLGFTEIGDHPFTVNTQQGGNLCAVILILDLSLLFFAYWDKVLAHVSHVHHACSVLEHIILLILAKAQNIESFIGKLHVLPVIDGWDSQFSLRYKPVILDVVTEETFLLQIRNLIRHDVVECVITTLQGLLVGQT